MKNIKFKHKAWQTLCRGKKIKYSFFWDTRHVVGFGIWNILSLNCISPPLFISVKTCQNSRFFVSNLSEASHSDSLYIPNWIEINAEYFSVSKQKRRWHFHDDMSVFIFSFKNQMKKCHYKARVSRLSNIMYWTNFTVSW